MKNIVSALFVPVLPRTRALTLIAAFLCGACGGAGQKTTTPEAPRAPIDDNLIALVPGDATAVLSLDAEELRRSPAWKAYRTLSSDESAGLFKIGPEVELFLNSSEAIFAFRSDTVGADQFLLLIKGGASSEAVLEMFSRRPEAVRETRGPFQSIRHPDFVLIALTDKTVAFGSEGMLNQMLGLVQGEGRSLLDVEAHKDLTLPSGGILTFSYERSSQVPDLTRYGAPNFSVAIDTIKKADALVENGHGLHIALNIEAETQMDAAVIARELRQTQAALSRNMLVLFLGVDWLIDRFTVSAEKDKVAVEGTLDDSDIEELERLAERLKKIRDLAEGTGGAIPLQLPGSALIDIDDDDEGNP